MNPANDVIEICFLSDLCQIRGEGSPYSVAALTHRVTSQTTATLKYFFAVISIAFLLFGYFALKARLPQIEHRYLTFYKG